MISRVEKWECAPILTFVRILAAVLLISAPLVLESSSAFAQAFGNSSTTANLELQGNYSSLYPVGTAEATHPLTLSTEYHLYHPGETIRVQGTAWTELVEKVKNLDIVKVELKDGAGNVVAREEANVSAINGDYSTSVKLLDSAGKGTYTVSANAEINADALGIIKTITSAALQSSMQIAVATAEEHNVNAENQDFMVTIASNSAITDFKFNQQEKKISFLVEGNSGTTGVAEITLPKKLLSGDMTVFVDQNLVAKENVLLKSDTETETTFEINYHHSIHRVEVAGTSVVPEFPIAMLAMAASIGSMIAVYAIVMTRRRVHTGL